MTGKQIAKKEDTAVSVYQVFDALDDELILDEIKGRITEAWVYDAGGKIGISKKGVDQSILEMAKQGWVFEELDVKVFDDPSDADYKLFTARVQAFRYTKEREKIEQGIQIGSKRQWIKMRLTSGALQPDPFWYEKGCAKAIRNAKLRFIPVEIESAVIALAKQSGRVKKVNEREAVTVSDQTKPSLEERYKSRMRYLMNWVSKEWKLNPDKNDGEIKKKLGNIVGEDILSKSEFVENDEFWDKFSVHCQEIVNARAEAMETEKRMANSD